MGKYAILDIGTNSIKFFLTEIVDGKQNTIVDTNNISRLGEGLLKTGKISEESMDRNITALRDFKQQAEEYNADQLVAVGTMCLRSADNASVFIKRVKDELDISIEVIDGKEEARLSYLAVLSTIGNTNRDVVVFDTGGGSTEFIYGQGNTLLKRISLNIGAVQPTEKYLLSDPVKSEEVKDMLAYIKSFFKQHGISGKADYLVGIGGTVTSMGAVKHRMTKYDPTIIQGSELTLKEVNNQIQEYSNKTIEERKQIPGLQPKRADIILAGAGIVQKIMESFKVNSFFISDRGLRHGLLYDRFLMKKDM